MTHTLDSFDRKILNLLQVDGTLSVDKISERVGLSRNACWRRVKWLEDNSIIKSRVALIDPEKVGLPLLVYVLVRTDDHTPTWIKKFRDAISASPEIISTQRMTGDLDYILRVRVADVKAYDSFYQRLIAKVPIADVSASFVMEDRKETTAFLV